jgi:N-acetylmuramoyl-L-alanine amidase
MIKKITLSLTLMVVVMLSFPVLTQAFSDVSNQVNNDISFLVKEGIITGYPDGTFRPKDTVTRAEAVVMLGRAQKKDITSIDSSNLPFSDVSKKHFAREYIQYAVNDGIVKGFPDNTYKPDEGLTRGDMAMILMDAFDFSTSNAKSFTDVKSSDYYYKAIQAIFSAGVTNGYPDGTYQPKKLINRHEFSIMLTRILDASLETAVTRTMHVDVNTTLNVRTGPGTSYKSIGSLIRNQQVIVQDTNETWVEIEAGNLKGYVNRDYLSFNPVGEAIFNRIIIDPGHGGKDPGAVENGILEKELVLDVSKRVRELLLKENIEVIMTRDTDKYLTLEERVDIAKKHQVDGFVSVHANSFTSDSANGTEAFVRSASLPSLDQKSAKLAESIHLRLLDVLGTRDRGVKKANFYVIRYNPHPATLLELGFISNPTEAALLNRKRQDMAVAIKDGILDYYKWVSRQ